VTWKNSLDAFKKGDFKEAEKGFKELNKIEEQVAGHQSNITVSPKATIPIVTKKVKTSKPENIPKKLPKLESSPQNNSIRSQMLRNHQSAIESAEEKIASLKKIKAKNPSNDSVKEQIDFFTQSLNEARRGYDAVKKMKEEDFFSKPSAKYAPRKKK
jgi:TolA-binding protein